MIFLFSVFYIILYTCDVMITETTTSTSKCPNETLVWTWKLNNTDNIQSLTWTKGSTILLEYNPKLGQFPYDNRSSYENDTFKLSKLVPDDSGIYSMEVQYGNRPSSRSSVILNVYDWITESPSIHHIRTLCQGALLNCSIPSNAVDTTIVWTDASGKTLTTHYLYNATTCGNYTCKMSGGAAQCMKKNTQPQAKYLISDCNCKKIKEEATNVNVISGICVAVGIVAVGTVIGVVTYIKIFRRKNIYENTANNNEATGYDELVNVKSGIPNIGYGGIPNTGYVQVVNDEVYPNISEGEKPNLSPSEPDIEESLEEKSSENDELQKANDNSTPPDESKSTESGLSGQKPDSQESPAKFVGNVRNGNDDTESTNAYKHIDSQSSPQNPNIEHLTQNNSPVVENSENVQNGNADSTPTNGYECTESKSPSQKQNSEEFPKILCSTNDISSQKEDDDPVHLNESENGKAKSTLQNTNTEELPEEVSYTNGGNLQKDNDETKPTNEYENIEPNSTPQNPSTQYSTQTISPVIENSENLQNGNADSTPTNGYESTESKSPLQKQNIEESPKIRSTNNISSHDDAIHLNESESGESKSTLQKLNTEEKIASTNDGFLQKDIEHRVELSPSPQKPNTEESPTNISSEIKNRGYLQKDIIDTATMNAFESEQSKL